MKTQIAIATSVLAFAGSANAAFQVTNSFATFDAGVAGAVTPIVSGALLYGSGSGATAQAGTWGLTFVAASNTNNMASTASTVTINAAVSLQTVTFTFPSAGTFPVRGFGIYYTGGGASPFNISVAINGVLSSANPVQIATGPNAFLGIYQDRGAGPDISSVEFIISGAPGNSITITGSAFALIPAPGAVALVGVAGLVGSRRRR
jgi:hypothetical protein